MKVVVTDKPVNTVKVQQYTSSRAHIYLLQLFAAFPTMALGTSLQGKARNSIKVVHNTVLRNISFNKSRCFIAFRRNATLTVQVILIDVKQERCKFRSLRQFFLRERFKIFCKIVNKLFSTNSDGYF